MPLTKRFVALGLLLPALAGDAAADALPVHHLVVVQVSSASEMLRLRTLELDMAACSGDALTSPLSTTCLEQWFEKPCRSCGGSCVD